MHPIDLVESPLGGLLRLCNHARLDDMDHLMVIFEFKLRDAC